MLHRNKGVTLKGRQHAQGTRTMLTVLTAPSIHPEIETIDRDPGIITLLAALVRAGRTAAGQARAFHEGASRLSFSATAWPYHR
jgi:hypothetical protein